MNLEDIILSETSQSQKGQIVYDSPYMRAWAGSHSQRQKVEWGSHGWARGYEEAVFNADRVAVLQDEKF